MDHFNDTLAACGAQRRFLQESHRRQLDELSAELAAQSRVAIRRSRVLLDGTRRQIEAAKWIRESATDREDGRSPDASCSR
jgi:hypothetical protein